MSFFNAIINSLFSNSTVNPLKILVLFLSMAILSIFLDEIGFFKYLANVTLKKAGKSQKKLFFLLYVIVSVLTVFTSNDIIILTFTPFICYFSSNAKINPLPYLITVFVAANTWSMALIIGNPTNIYLGTASNVDFLQYLKIMILPTIFTGISSFCMLYLIFRKSFETQMNRISSPHGHIKHIGLLTIGILHLGACTVILAISAYINIEMWIVAFFSVISLIFFNIVIAIVKKRRPKELICALRRAPWTLVPFLLSMFILILFLEELGLPQLINKFLGQSFPILKYGFSSFFAANIINNIPMSVLFSNILQFLDDSNKQKAIFAVIIGSNIGALFTPIGALAGVMWKKILKTQGINFSFKDFIRYCGAVAIPAMTFALFGLWIACE